MEFQQQGYLGSSSLTSLKQDDPSPTLTYHKKNTHEVEIIKKISSSKFPIYLCVFPETNTYVYLKCYPYVNDKVSPYYIREARFKNFNHPNILAIHSADANYEFVSDPRKTHWSYILMEETTYGSLYSCIVSGLLPNDEKITRTYFHQLVQGIEYLHSRKIAHSDLKLENIYIGKDYTLKIGNFMHSQVHNEAPLPNKYTDGYKAPEVRNNECQNPLAADIYSVGVILFILKFRKFPCLESLMASGKVKECWMALYKMYSAQDQPADPGFEVLLMDLVNPDPSKRPKAEDIKTYKWYQGPVYSFGELASPLKVLKPCDR